MAESRSKTLKCRIHDQDSYKFYCKQCQECICLQCIEELHEDHTFCRLECAEGNIRHELKVIIEDLKDNSKTIQGILSTLNNIEDNLCIERIQLTSQIERETEKIILNINESKQKAIQNLDALFDGRRAFVDIQKGIIERLKARIAEQDVESMDLADAVEITLTARAAFAEIKDFTDEKAKTRFVGNDSDISIGQLKGVESGLYYIEAKTGIQTELNDDDRADAQVKNDNSSDKSDEITYPMVISGTILKDVKKIIPVNHNDAWILVGANLMKITSNVLESTTYASSIKDFAVLSKGSVLLVKTDEAFIQEKLTNGRISPFIDVGSSDSLVPLSLSVDKDMIYVNIAAKTEVYDEYLKRQTRRTFCKLGVFTMEGIQISTTDVTLFGHGILPSLAIHYTQSGSESIYYCLFKLFGMCRSSIHLLSHKAPETPKTIATFRGAFGAKPETIFKCTGACIDKNGNVLVSDQNYKKVYALDKNLKFKSVVLSNDDIDLQNPQGVAILDGILWVADDEKIHKLKYNSQDATLCK